MRAKALRSVIRADLGTARLGNAADTVLDIRTGGFTSGLLIIEMADRVNAATLDVTLAQGAMVGAVGAFAGAAYTPPAGGGGAFAQFASDSVATRRVTLEGDVLRVTLNHGAAAADTYTSRVTLVAKQGVSTGG